MAWAAAWTKNLLERARDSAQSLARALEQIEVYISKRSNATWSHGACPECFARLQERHEPIKG